MRLNQVRQPPPTHPVVASLLFAKIPVPVLPDGFE
jgi:hypothetical protein